MEKRKFLIVEKNLLKAIELERQLIELGGESIGIATDYLTTMLLINDVSPEVVYINPNLTLEAEGLGVAKEIEKKVKCEIFIFTSALSKTLKERFVIAYQYCFIDEAIELNLISSLKGGVGSDACS